VPFRCLCRLVACAVVDTNTRARQVQVLRRRALWGHASYDTRTHAQLVLARSRKRETDAEPLSLTFERTAPPHRTAPAPPPAFGRWRGRRSGGGGGSKSSTQPTARPLHRRASTSRRRRRRLLVLVLPPPPPLPLMHPRRPGRSRNTATREAGRRGRGRVRGSATITKAATTAMASTAAAGPPSPPFQRATRRRRRRGEAQRLGTCLGCRARRSRAWGTPPGRAGPRGGGARSAGSPQPGARGPEFSCSVV